jgi:spore germination protein
MNIHVVQPGDTVYNIANKYGISSDRLVIDNDIHDADKLVVGETLVIVEPKQLYIVQQGDTLSDIADTHGVSIMQLLRNNPYLSDREFLYEGEEIVISYIDIKTSKISTNGFAFPFIDKLIMKKTLPFLTYLSILNYRASADGDLYDINDEELIQMAKTYGVAPIMFLTTLTEEGLLDIDVMHKILNNNEVQNNLINNIVTSLKLKGYYGLNIDTQYISPCDRPLYVNWVTNIANRLNSEGFKVFVTISPSTFEVATGIIYEGIDYAGLSKAADGILFHLSYEWGYPYGLPKSFLPFEKIIYTLEKALIQIPPEKFTIGITSIGYFWKLPYIASLTPANFISLTNVVHLANEFGINIEFDEYTRSSYFRYVEDNYEYMVWFKDSRIIDSTAKVIQTYGLEGIGIWNIMYFFNRLWLLFNVQFDIEKIYN